MSITKTTSIKDYNAAVTKQSGRVGNVRYYTKKGITYVRAASNSTVTNSRTNSQMTQRLHFSALAALYSTMGEHLKFAFPKREKNQSSYNMFMKLNQEASVYMTKQQRDLGYSVAMPVVVASGKLGQISTAISGGNAVTDLSIAGVNPATCTIGQLSVAIIGNNEGWDDNHQLTLVVLRQVGNYCRPKYVRIVLDRTSETLVSAFGAFAAVSGKLAIAITGDVCVGFIHSNSDGDMSLCKLVASDSMKTIIDGYLTDEAFATASASYGKSVEKFLVPSKGKRSSSDENEDENENPTPTPSAKKTVTLTVSPEGAGTVSGAGQYDAGATAHLVATANSGYQFVRWNDNDTNASRDVTVNSDLTLNAIFTTAGGDDLDQG